MKSLGEAAAVLPWLSPCASSLVTLARQTSPAIWAKIRHDPGCVLLFARAASKLPPSDEPLASAARISVAIETAIPLLGSREIGFVDWDLPSVRPVLNICLRQANVAHSLSRLVGCDPERAWAAALLAPLGWLALCAADPSTDFSDLIGKATDSWQQKHWGIDHTAIARRLSRQWQLPPWLGTVVGQLGLHVDVARRLGADPVLFQLVQLAVLLVQDTNKGLNLRVVATRDELTHTLKISSSEVNRIRDEGPVYSASSFGWESPQQAPLLVDLLELSLHNRRLDDTVFVESLQREIDTFHEALAHQQASENDRLQQLKMTAIGEMAAGAGHEINNPLAVISGQAQFALRQMQAIQNDLTEETSALHLLETIKEKLGNSLEKIVGQSQRIHHVLKDLMQFARPPLPKKQTLPVTSLISEVAASLEEFASQKQVRLVCPASVGNIALNVDPGQARTALTGLLRNAIEAAPADGWAGMRVEPNGNSMIKIVVEDNGEGPPLASQEHLFDPFYSGRSAGRGRGLGLSTAWRLARQHDGDVRFEGTSQGLTRFVLYLPAIEAPAAPINGNGNGHRNGNGNGHALLSEFV